MDSYNNKILLGLLSITVFLGGRTIVVELADEFDFLFKNSLFKALVMYSVLYINTSDNIVSISGTIIYLSILKLKHYLNKQKIG